MGILTVPKSNTLPKLNVFKIKGFKAYLNVIILFLFKHNSKCVIVNDS